MHWEASESAVVAARDEDIPLRATNDVGTAIARTCRWFLRAQQEDGHWCAELEGDTILESEYILLMAWLGRERHADSLAAARYIAQQQMPSGGWSLFPGGPLDISVSVKAYFARKLTGASPDEPSMRLAREQIIAAGGADRVNSFTRFYLALLGQIAYTQCPAAPPEIILLPDWSPINLYRMSAWSRTIVVPLTIMWALRPVRRLDQASGIRELFCQPPEQWSPLRSPGLTGAPSGWERAFRLLDQFLKQADQWHVRPFRKRALRAAERWMLERFKDSDGLGAIFPPIVWSIIALRSLGYELDHPALLECFRQLDGLKLTGRAASAARCEPGNSVSHAQTPVLLDAAGRANDAQEPDTLRLQPCKSPVWDTALAQRALLAMLHVAEEVDQPLRAGALRATVRSTRWLLDREIRRAGDWSRRVRVEPSGWCFEYRNAFYPDIDDTIMVMMALRAAAGRLGDERCCLSKLSTSSSSEAPLANGSGALVQEIEGACRRATDWVLALQNRDGGWGAFDRDNDAEFLCHVPFADHNAIIDPSTPDITARVLEALAGRGLATDHASVRRAIAYLRETQESDGSWYGRWGVNYIYGTWQVLVGLAAMGVAPHDPLLTRGVQWLVDRQQPSGAWGESALSYADDQWRGRGAPTASQTAWAVLGLMAAQCPDRSVVARGIQYLIDTQRPDGGWDEPEFTGTGFPRVFYLRYHMYPLYFPLLALSEFRTWQSRFRR